MIQKKHETFRKKILKVLLVILIPLISILMIYNFYAIHMFNENIAESYENSLDLYQYYLEQNLSIVESFVAEIVGNDVNFQTLRNKQTELGAYEASYDVLLRLQSDTLIQELVGGYILISNMNGIDRVLFESDYSIDTKDYFREYIKGIVAVNGIQNFWQTANYEDTSILFRAYGNQDTCIVAIIDLKKGILSFEDPSQENLIDFFSETGIALIHPDFVRENDIIYKNDIEEPYFSGGKNQFMIISNPINKTDVSMVYMVSYKGYMHQLTPVQLILVLVSFATIILIPISITWLNKFVFHPIKELSSTMELIKKGNMDAKLEGEFYIDEFDQLRVTFNDMMYQIKSLKIDAYENKIELEHAQLQYLQLQIRPHFYLNTLKNMYALAETESYEHIQELIIAVSNHMRYTFRDNMSLITLKTELEHVKNYIRIQKLSSNYDIHLEILMEPGYMDFEIPTLMIQTFVENSIKYGFERSKELRIKITIEEKDEKELSIIIEDNGKGFRKEMLHEINGEQINIYSEKYVGIANIKKRLQLLYEKVSIQFSNREHGAVVEIIFPVKP